MTETIESISAEELASLMESRAHVYQVLSRCFQQEIDAPFAEELSRQFVLEGAAPAAAQAMEAMQQLLSGADDAALEQLAVTFDRVFFGMGPITARHAFPYESVYTSDRGIMMQQAYGQVVQAYRQQRLAKDPAFKEPEDHLAVELAFMATLAQRCALFLSEGHEEAAEETAVQQLAFAQDHLLNWLDRFCADLKVAAGGGFYFHLACFAQAFVEEDASLLREMLEG